MSFRGKIIKKSDKKIGDHVIIMCLSFARLVFDHTSHHCQI